MSNGPSGDASTDFVSGSGGSHAQRSRSLSVLSFAECAKLLQDISEHFGMDKRTTNYAISYLDIIIREGVQPRPHAYGLEDSGFTCPAMEAIVEESIVVCACLLIASKFNDVYNIIRLKRLQEYIEEKYPTIAIREDQINKFEVQVLQAL